MIRKLACAALLACSAASAFAQSFPAKPVTIVVPNPPGGLVDTSARLVGDPLAKLLNQSVIIDNRAGGSGNIAYQYVARSKPDGYTLLSSYSAYHTGYPHLMSKLPWEPKDFAPVALVTVATNVITVHPSLPVNNLKELLAYLKKNPNKVNYASQGNGSLSHIGTELFKQQTGTEIQHVPYKGSGQAIQDVLAGQVQMFITTPPSVIQHIQTGKLKALAVAGKSRHPMLPNVPTTAEAGLPGFELEAWVALFAPAGTPQPVIAKLSEEVKLALDQPDTKSRAAAQGVELRYQSPEALGAMVKKELDYWGGVIKKANITLD
ncbi:Tripartite-type tricarboxylate transporter, receptor component TctC [Noviherbaspirillum humi]|uniref:Tripartite-type tricarboxylate transporter, receptor component TctC n=1 Tax=Noviherbaspirillum humi TaxID=1688639 RepID=A0A239HTS6_9BURK|nr:tripartite tricarboxylate transporter substrate binding protein [Noviherbaspirillum humi]SNS84183.1 Tripartite-type tricarboxylate transporter, receptor component TctC [Noviherbaspirillum humi]